MPCSPRALISRIAGGDFMFSFHKWKTRLAKARAGRDEAAAEADWLKRRVAALESAFALPRATLREMFPAGAPIEEIPMPAYPGAVWLGGFPNRPGSPPSTFRKPWRKLKLSYSPIQREAMPTYDYRCDDCGDFALMRPMAQRDEPVGCPQCGKAAARALVAAPALAGAPGAVPSELAGHGAGCACCGPVKLAGRADGGRGGAGWSKFSSG